VNAGEKHLPPGARPKGFGFPFAARYLTLLIFLNDVPDGGNTILPLLGPKPLASVTASLKEVMGNFGNVNPGALVSPYATCSCL